MHVKRTVATLLLLIIVFSVSFNVGFLANGCSEDVAVAPDGTIYVISRYDRIVKYRFEEVFERSGPSRVAVTDQHPPL